jgi:uncharacterized protein YbjT (DUF2867 family)
MKLAIFGATGRAGGALLDRGLEAGHDLHALVRHPEKLGRAASGLTVSTGEVRDLAAVSRVVQGADAVVNAIGGTSGRNPAVLEHGTATIPAAMERHGVGRLIVVQGFHLPFPGDPENVGRALVRSILRLVNWRLLEDSYRMAERLRESTLGWTLVRMPPLRTSPRRDGYRVGQFPLGPWSHVTTGQVADFALRCLTGGEYRREAPMIAAAGRAARAEAVVARGART